MELGEIEHLAKMFVKMIEKHPELCPHDYTLAYGDLKTGIYHYRCQYCGHMISEPIPEEELKRFKD